MITQEKVDELQRVKLKYDMIVTNARKDYYHCYQYELFDISYHKGYCDGVKRISKSIIDIDSL